MILDFSHGLINRFKKKTFTYKPLELECEKSSEEDDDPEDLCQNDGEPEDLRLSCCH